MAIRTPETRSSVLSCTFRKMAESSNDAETLWHNAQRLKLAERDVSLPLAHYQEKCGSDFLCSITGEEALKGDLPFAFSSVGHKKSNAVRRILFITCPGVIPKPSGGGTPMIAGSLIQEFIDEGWVVGFVAFIKPEKWSDSKSDIEILYKRQNPEVVSYWFSARTVLELNRYELSAIANEFKPELIYCFGHEASALAEPLGNYDYNSYRKIVTLYDPLHFGSWYKILEALSSPRPKSIYQAMRKVPSLIRAWRRYRSEELPALHSADLVIVHSYNHSKFYQSALNRPVLYFPNPLSAVTRVTRSKAGHPPVFIMAGALNSSVTRSGLRFLLQHVVSKISNDLEGGKYGIRIIGGGKLDEGLAALRKIPGIEFLGHVSHASLLEEYSCAVALLVPTPIRLGFRTRIVDAFRYGIPVIAHSANRAGFKELTNEQNCLLANTGAEFAHAMSRAISSTELMNDLTENAYAEFKSGYSVSTFAKLVVSKVEVLSANRRRKVKE